MSEKVKILEKLKQKLQQLRNDLEKKRGQVLGNLCDLCLKEIIEKFEELSKEVERLDITYCRFYFEDKSAPKCALGSSSIAPPCIGNNDEKTCPVAISFIKEFEAYIKKVKQ